MLFHLSIDYFFFNLPLFSTFVARKCFLLNLNKHCQVVIDNQYIDIVSYFCSKLFHPSTKSM